MGLNLPRVASRVRWARFLTSRSLRSRATSCSTVWIGEKRLLVAWAKKAASASGAARRPRLLSASGTLSLGWVIVVLEVVRDDVEIENVVGEGGGVAQTAAGFDPASIEGIDTGDQGAQPVATLELPGGALEAQDLGAVLGMLDELTAAPAAVMTRDLERAVDDPHHGVVDDQGERLADRCGRDRVEVGVEAHAGGLVGRDRQDAIGGGRGGGQRQELRSFLGEQVGDRAVAEHGMRARQRDRFEEAREFAVAGGEIGDAAAGEEALAQVAHGTFDASLLVALADRAQPG